MSLTLIPAQDWPAVSRLFDEALDLPEDERAAWLARLATEQPALAPAVQALLWANARRETGDFLERGPQFSVAPADDRATALEPGQPIGPYRLLRPLGQGGMAVVWLAERGDGSLDREVALKLPQQYTWRPGLAERFQRERDILARLEHPHIARLYDAGLSAPEGPGGGRPYLAMEYVQGSSLTAYCDERRLGVAARLALAEQVMAAVQYAHTRLVIHRDIKPANILVTQDGEVRLLDFGVAKLLQAEDGSERTELTQLAGRAFTPDFASPEQVRGEALGTTSDVYSLGVVLYELLCGQRPYQLRYESAAQLEQAILDAEPAPPSSRADADGARARGTTADKLRRALRGELDTIVLKALKKRPEDRYATVTELAEDLRRCRDGEPVLARPDSWAYRAGKLLKRNKAVAGGITATVMALAVGLGAALWQGRMAQEQRDRALRAVERSNGVNDFIADLLRDAARGEQGTHVKALLDRGIAVADAGYAKDPELQADLLMMIGNFKASLQGPAAALPLFDRVKALLPADADWNQVLRLRCSRLQPDLYTGRIKVDEARKTIADIVANPATTPDEGAACLYQLASIEGVLGDRLAAIATERRALSLLDRSTVSNPKEHAVISGLLASDLVLAGQVKEGQALFEAVDGEFANLRMERSYSGYVLRGNWATSSLLTGSPRRALELSERSLAWLRQDMPHEPPPPNFIYTRAAAASELGRYETALEGCRELLTAAERVHEDRLVLAAHVVTSGIQAQLGQLEAAERAYSAATAIKSPMLAPGHFGQLALEQARMALDFKEGHLAQARQHVDVVLADPATNKPQRQQARLTRALIGLAAGTLPEALADAQAAVALGRDLQGDLADSVRTGKALLALAKVQRAMGQHEASHATLAESVRQLGNSVDETHLALIEARTLLREPSAAGG